MNTLTNTTDGDRVEEAHLADLLTDLPYLRVISAALEHTGRRSGEAEQMSVNLRVNAGLTDNKDDRASLIGLADRADRRSRRLRALTALLHDELDEAVSDEVAGLDFADDGSKATCRAAIWQTATGKA